MNPPLPVELLVSDDQRRLDATLADECQEPARRVSVGDHHRFRESMARIQKPNAEVHP